MIRSKSKDRESKKSKVKKDLSVLERQTKKVKVEDEDFVPLGDYEEQVTLNVLPYVGDGKKAVRPPWMFEQREKYRSLEQELTDFCIWVLPTDREIEVREESINRLKGVVAQTFNDYRVSCFNIGSFHLGLYLPGSDLDFVVMNASESAHNPLRKLATSLRNKRHASQMQLIERSRVPIVKYTDIKTSVECDVSFDMEGGIVVGHVFKRILKEPSMKHAKSLVLLVKYWLRGLGLHEPFNGGMGSYSVLILVIYHLQRNADSRNKTLAQLFVSFFEFYGTKFNWISTGISIRSGGYCFAKEDRGEVFNKYNGTRPALEDPVDPSNNISLATSALFRIREAMRQTHALLSSGKEPEYGILPEILLGPHPERLADNRKR